MKFENIASYTYFRRKDGTLYTDFTKEEINNMIVRDGKDAFIYFCEQLNIPFIKYEYNKLKEKDPNNILGRYLSKMRLTSFKPYTYEDSNKLNERYES